MLTMSFWLLMLTGNEFWQDFWETYETSSKYELPQVDVTIPSSFYCASVSETGYSQLSPYRSFSLTCICWAAMQISWSKKEVFTWEKRSVPKGFFLYINMAAVFLFCTPIWPPWRHVTTICRATGRVAFKTSGNFCKQSLHFIFRLNITP